MKIYEGYRLPDGRCRVVVSNSGHKRPLPPRIHARGVLSFPLRTSHGRGV